MKIIKPIDPMIKLRQEMRQNRLADKQLITPEEIVEFEKTHFIECTNYCCCSKENCIDENGKKCRYWLAAINQLDKEIEKAVELLKHNNYYIIKKTKKV